ncbi:hypothetical protein A2954_03635 [Candidatus Roizmanbacteria bacterium RIFCSPLOWO2_01_FULL_37_12]|uniref:UDP-N-acetylmuramyl-tripeptide synthetase n=1 Tax=Candidatus Roizmanbacteria bacterium RIFCSPLOWO2_01_FULL_37_12 TaxID=1802056 RepID=A0A1F7IEK3_9BACT|nr:MAG: hypothetical protein A3D76_05245 [Candidatus Roizmanbacteria bacterium RIFCSPHIGHO2_02_FULL_37_9b]OGK41781.1 MAG: hypothetical protein A2954_03635 [Candidatus Roizmanbacteria bacterium RIFCSPLOWO2_01_FULL_37_12]
MEKLLQNIKNLYHLFQSIIANVYYGFPSHKLKMIGVTGTDGKTTTTHLIYHILKTSGKKVSMVSSVYANIAGKTYDIGFHVTTPDVFPLQKYLRQSVDAGDDYFVLETTSHALAQNRSSLIDYEAGVLTNITHEHLDWHKTYRNYVMAKAILLQRAKIALLNADDISFSILKKLLDKKIWTYGLKNKGDFNLDIDKKLKLNLARFNNYNYLAAYSICKLLGLKVSDILNALKTFQLPPGRLEIVVDNPFKIIIDFAHTPNALHEVLSEVKRKFIKKGNRLIHVFGSAAKRDVSKRPLMGKESNTYADKIILTEEDYRDEDPLKINNEIAQTIDKDKYEIIINRQEAIEKAVTIAKPGDVVILTGKSHEKSLCRGKKEVPWNEKQAAIDALKKYDYL